MTMRFIDRLYFGERAKRKSARLVKKIRKGSRMTGAYVVCLPENGSDPMEFFSARLLSQEYYKTHEPVILGIAADEDEAVEVVNSIIKDCIEKTGSVDIRNYTEMLAGPPYIKKGEE
ncbi:MAG: hypothetical protein IJS86_02535 [Lachnospiraceae bacterium]|nr:hypothetical protein [Lachnospiraceae bacterium]